MYHWFRIIFLLICLTGFISGLVTSKSFGQTEEFDKKGLEQLDAEYVNWNVNVATEELPEEGNNCLIKAGEVNFLLDPFYKGTVSQNCDIKAGSSLFFPFYEGWCDNGSRDMLGNNLIKLCLIAH